ncbi:MAG: DUF1592 domain-containing protein [Myxococcota bacterium]
MASCGQGEIGAPRVLEGSDDPSFQTPNFPNAGDGAPPGTPGTVGQQGLSFSCDPNLTSPVPELRRLTQQQYENALAALAESWVGDAEGVMAEVADDLERIPPDVLSEDADYQTMVKTVGQSHVDAYHETGIGFGRAVAARDPLGCSDATCVRDRVTDMASRAFRRPVTSAEVDFLVDDVLGSVDSEGVAALAAVLVSSPDFLYILEDGAAPTQGGRELAPHELATRLALHFWQAPADEALLEAARSGQLDTDDGYRAEVDRIFQDPRTQETMRNFFSEWLELEAVPEMDAFTDRPDFVAYSGDDLPDSTLRGELIEDTLAFIDHVTWNENGDLADLFSSNLALPPTEDVAALYGVPFSGPGVPVSLDPNRRAGLLSRPAFLANNQAATRPIIRGVRIRVRLMCGEFELPDNMEGIQGPEPTASRTTRETVEALTEEPGSTCVGCHSFINPFGFALESYDALGRYRSEEQIFSSDGSLAASFPVNPSATGYVGGEEVTFADASAMSALLAESPEIQACFARHYFRYSFGRREDIRTDGCTLESIRSSVASGASIAEVLRDIALQPEFRRILESDG